MTPRARPRPIALLWGLVLLGVGTTVLAHRALASNAGPVIALAVTLTAVGYLAVSLRGLSSTGGTLLESDAGTVSESDTTRT